MRRWSRGLVALCAMGAQGCYVGAQRTTLVAKTETLDPAGDGPSSDMSLTSDNLEVTFGTYLWLAELFIGLGGGTEAWHQRSSTSASTDDIATLSTRLSIGASIPFYRFDFFELRVLGIYAGNLGSSNFGDPDPELPELVSSEITDSLEVGIELSGRYRIVDPILRIGLARIDGYAQPMLYVDEDRFGRFEATAFFATLGLNLNVFDIMEEVGE